MAVLIVALTLFAPESEAWKQHRPTSMTRIFGTLLEHKGIFLYLLLMMTVLLCLSHGTQDFYPDFLKSIPGITAEIRFRNEGPLRRTHSVQHWCDRRRAYSSVNYRRR